MFFYNEWALRIVRGAWTDHLAFYGLPGYPWLLAGLYGLFGYSPFLPAFLQACLEAGTAVLILKLAEIVFAREGSDLFPARVIGTSAAVGWAFFVPAQVYAAILMPTAWLVFVFWFVVWAVLRRPYAPGWPGAAALGLLIGLTATGVATILFLLPLLFAALFFRARPGARAWRPLAAALALAAGLLLGTSPAWAHNYFVARDPVFLSAHSGINFWIGNNPEASGYPRFPPGLRAGQAAMLQDSISAAETAAGRPLRRSEVSRYWSARAREYIQAEPGAFLRLLGRKILNFWSAFQYDDLSIITSFRENGIVWPGPAFGLVAILAWPGMVHGPAGVPAFALDHGRGSFAPRGAPPGLRDRTLPARRRARPAAFRRGRAFSSLAEHGAALLGARGGLSWRSLCRYRAPGACAPRAFALGARRL